MEGITSNLELLSALGLFVGMGDIYLARMTKEDTASTPPEYATPYLAMEGIRCGLTPQYAEGKQSASDRTIRNIRLLTGMDVAMEYARVLAEVRCDVLGRTMDERGGELVADGMAPYFGVGVLATRDDGTCLMRWIYKVRFSEGAGEMRTMEDGTITYQIPTLEGKGVRLAYGVARGEGKIEHPVQYEMDTANGKCKMDVNSFFAQVQGPWVPVETSAKLDSADGAPVLTAATAKAAK